MGLARMYAALATGGTARRRETAVARPRITRMTTPGDANGRTDMFLGFIDCWGMGMALNTPGIYGPNPRAFGHSRLGRALRLRRPRRRCRHRLCLQSDGPGTGRRPQNVRTLRGGSRLCGATLNQPSLEAAPDAPLGSDGTPSSFDLMDIKQDALAAIGNTPLIRLKRASELTGCEILGKAEFMNPGQSVKDRAALSSSRDAIERGTLKPGGVIVEGTAGNTGIGLAVVGNALGFRTVIVIPDTQSQEKKDALRLLGAELIEVPAVPYKDPNNYVKFSGRLAEQLAKSEPKRRDLGQPVRQCRQPARAYRDDRPRNLAADRRQGRRLHLRRRHRRHARRHRRSR